jgi:hypothetical protein
MGNTDNLLDYQSIAFFNFLSFALKDAEENSLQLFYENKKMFKNQ